MTNPSQGAQILQELLETGNREYGEKGKAKGERDVRDDGQKRIRKDLKDCFRAAIKAADPTQAMASHVASRGGAIEGLLPGYHHRSEGRIILLGAGKAAGKMGAAVERMLGDRLTGGILVGSMESTEGTVRRVRGNHPLVGAGSVEGGEALLSMAQGLKEDDWAVCVFSDDVKQHR